MSPVSKEYKDWLKQLKDRIHSSQLKAAIKVNTELVQLYWHLGIEILRKEKDNKYGKNLIQQLSQDLLHEFPQIKGFSRTNLYFVRQWVQFYTQKRPIVQQPVGQLQEPTHEIDSQWAEVIPTKLFLIPWGHHQQIISKCKDYDQALFYIHETVKNNWSRNVLLNQIESDLWRRQGKAITNFDETLPAIQSDLAREIIKDPYSFDFLDLTKEHKERELESALIDNLTRFLIELGTGFSYVGRQYPLNVGNKEFFIDLLFYHLKLRCFVVVELKAGEFLPEYTGKLNFYLNAVDDTLKHKDDNPTIGLLICKERNEIITEYALRGISRPIGISKYKVNDPLPEYLKDSLPTAEQIEAGLAHIK